MPFNGSGTYAGPALPGSWNPATTGSSATPADWNTLLTDLSTALSTTITKDGQTTVTANIPMNTHKITGLGNGTAAQDAATFIQVGQHDALQSGAVNTTTTQIPADDTVPTSSEGNEFFSQTFTPKSATSTLWIEVVIMGSCNAASAVVAGLFKDASVSAFATGWDYCAAADAPCCISFTAELASVSTAAITFKVRAGPVNAVTFTLNGQGGVRRFGGTMASGIFISEIMA